MQSKKEILEECLYLDRVVTNNTKTEEYILLAMERYANQKNANLEAKLLNYWTKLNKDARAENHQTIESFLEASKHAFEYAVEMEIITVKSGKID